MTKATKLYGATDFGDNGFLKGLTKLCSALNDESELHPMGRLMAKTSILRILRNRLELEARWKEHPEVLSAPVEQPVFIVSQPRTGTTLLFHLLALDDRFRFMRSWEANWPGLPHGCEKLNRKAKKECKKTIDFQYYLRPDLKKIHYLAPEKPEECLPLLSNSFESGIFSFAYGIESYADWFHEQDHRYCYAYYQKQLQWLQNKSPGKRWLLKSPAHLSAFDALFETFPDALVIQIHRDPKKVIPSISNLRYVARILVSYTADKKQMAHKTLSNLAENIDYIINAKDNDAYNILDILYDDLVQRPMEVLAQIYFRLGWPQNTSLKARAESYLRANPKNKYGKHTYSLEEFGLQSNIIYDKLKVYYDHFNFAGH